MKSKGESGFLMLSGQCLEGAPAQNVSVSYFKPFCLPSPVESAGIRVLANGGNN